MPRFDYKCDNGHVWTLKIPHAELHDADSPLYREGKVPEMEMCPDENCESGYGKRQYTTFRFHMWKSWFENYNDERSPHEL